MKAEQKITVTLSSTSLVNAPGVLRWMRNMFKTEPMDALFVAMATWPALRGDVVTGLVADTLPGVLFDWPNNRVTVVCTEKQAGNALLAAMDLARAEATEWLAEMKEDDHDA